MDRRWSAFAMLFACAALLLGTAMTALAGWRLARAPDVITLAASLDWSGAVQRVAGSTLRDAPDPLSRW